MCARVFRRADADNFLFSIAQNVAQGKLCTARIAGPPCGVRHSSGALTNVRHFFRTPTDQAKSNKFSLELTVFSEPPELALPTPPESIGLRAPSLQVHAPLIPFPVPTCSNVFSELAAREV